MSWRMWVSGWRASRIPDAVKGPLPVSAPEAAPARVNADLPRPSTPPAVPTCGARDWLSGAVCTLGPGHWAEHADDSEPDTVIRWPQEGAVA